MSDLKELIVKEIGLPNNHQISDKQIERIMWIVSGMFLDEKTDREICELADRIKKDTKELFSMNGE